jgi:hypothetical protein
MKRDIWEVGVDKNVKEGGAQVEYEDQDPRIHRKFLEALKASGASSLMGDVFDEEAIMRIPAEDLTGVIQTPQLKGPAV